MTNSEYMPPGGVKELVKSAEGRRYFARLQKKYEIDILQPNDPRFKRVYGSRLKKFQETKSRQERMAKEEWMESAEKKRFEKEGRKIL